MTAPVAAPVAAERERSILRPGETGPGTLARTSVSQIGRFDVTQDGGCPTAWWFEKIDGRPTKTTAAQQAGTDLHSQVEHYLLTGEDVRGPLARAGKHLVPAPGPDLLVEHEFKNADLMAAGVPLLGYIDLVNPRGTHTDEEGLHQDPPGTVEVIDWKTTSDLKWAKSGSALVRTVQMPSYGEFVSRKFPGGEFVRLSHVYYRTKGAPHAEKRTALVPLTTIRSRWAQIEGVVREMKDVAQEGDVAKVPKNLDACGSYGGCPHAAYCPRPREAILASIFGKGDAMSLLQKLKAAQSAAPVVPAPAPVAPAAPAAVTVVTVPPVLGITKAPAAGNLDKVAAMRAQLAELERLAALEAGFEDSVDTTSDDLGVEDTFVVEPVVIAEPVAAKITLAKDAKKNAIYEGRMEDGSGFRVMFIGRLKSGLTFRRLDKEGTLYLEDDTGLVLVNELAVPLIPTGVTPPDAPKPGQSGPIFEPLKEGEVVPANVRAAAEALTPAAVAELPVVVTGIPAAPAEKRKPGRPRKDKTPAPVGAVAEAVRGAILAGEKGLDDVAVSVEILKDENAPVLARVAAAEVVLDKALESAPVRTREEMFAYPGHGTGAPANLAPFTLYLDCLPVKGAGIQSLDELVEGCCEALCKQYGAVDVRCAPNDTPLGFGKWKGALSAFVRENAPTSGSWSLVGVRESEIKSVAAEALSSKASVVIRPVG